MNHKLEQLKQMSNALEQIPLYRSRRDSISDLNNLIRNHGQELAQIRTAANNQARADWLDNEITKLTKERILLREQTDEIKQAIDHLRRQTADEVKCAKKDKAQGEKRPPRTVLNLVGQDINLVLKECPMVVSTGSAAKYLNPKTEWQNYPRLYFGMGGGSQRLTQGFPLDAVGLILVGETLRRVMGLKKCSILCADVITRTNPFPPDEIQRIMVGEFHIMRYLLDLFGFPGWKVLLHSDLHRMDNDAEVDKESIYTVNPTDCQHPEYVHILQVMFKHIDCGIARSPFAELGKDARGHEDNWHFALETALTEYLVGNGIHLGWYIPGPDIHSASQVETLIQQYGRSGLKRMDEEPFDSYHEETLAVAQAAGDWTKENRITPVYCKAGIRIPLDSAPNVVERVPPYICYYPERRILVTDRANELRHKLGGSNGLCRFNLQGALMKYWKDFVRLTELLSLPCAGDNLLQKLCAFQEYLNQDGQLGDLYAHAFPG